MRNGSIRAGVGLVIGLEKTLARIALRDDRFISSLPDGVAKANDLDRSNCALVRLAALIALDGSAGLFVTSIQEAQSAGVSPAEIVATLIAVLPSVGAIRASSAAGKIALGLGYEPDPV